MKSQILHTLLCSISVDAAGEIWSWSLLGVKGLKPIYLVPESHSITLPVPETVTPKWNGISNLLSPTPLGSRYYLLTFINLCTTTQMLTCYSTTYSPPPPHHLHWLAILSTQQSFYCCYLLSTCNPSHFQHTHFPFVTHFSIFTVITKAHTNH